MKMFLLGMLVMWSALSLMVWLMDFSEDDFRFANLIRRSFSLMYVIVYLIEYIYTFFTKVIWFLPLCIKYGINPFWTSMTIIYKKLGTDEARQKWISVVKNEEERKRWERVFKDLSKMRVDK